MHQTLSLLTSSDNQFPGPITHHGRPGEITANQTIKFLFRNRCYVAGVLSRWKKQLRRELAGCQRKCWPFDRSGAVMRRCSVGAVLSSVEHRHFLEVHMSQTFAKPCNLPSVCAIGKWNGIIPLEPAAAKLMNTRSGARNADILFCMQRHASASLTLMLGCQETRTAPPCIKKISALCSCQVALTASFYFLQAASEAAIAVIHVFLVTLLLSQKYG
ncbi:hypothetical protein BaRGS_00010521 [Batillaria attramentaria]|uniref:Uncharacterized protein n=1 Tax=Batillaria attramentaria TaxID=370345 RepID=A0ABD0LFW8_9CAEN